MKLIVYINYINAVYNTEIHCNDVDYAHGFVIFKGVTGRKYVPSGKREVSSSNLLMLVLPSECITEMKVYKLEV